MKTSSWFTKLPSDHVQVGISRGVPRGTAAGYRRFTVLNPGPWFNAAPLGEYLDRYKREILDRLDPAETVAAIETRAGSLEPVLVCYERPDQIRRAETWCHRHLV